MRLIRTLIVLAALMPLPARAQTDSISIGGLFSLSSWGQEAGSSELNGLLMALEEINASGGVRGQPLKLVTEDTQSDLMKTATAYRKLATADGVSMVIGPNWAEFTEVVAPLAERNKLVTITPSGYTEGIFEKNGYLFTLWHPHEVSVQPLYECVIAAKHRRIGVVVSESGYFQGLWNAMKIHGKETLTFDPVLPFAAGARDFRTSITRLKQQKLDAVMVFLLGSGDLGTFLQQADQLNLDLPLYSSNAIPFDEVIRKTPALADRVIYFDDLAPGTEQFRERYRKKFAREPGASSAHAYDAAFVAKNVLEKCGKDPSCLASSVKTISYKGSTGSISFESGIRRNEEQRTHLRQVQDGKFADLEGGCAKK